MASIKENEVIHLLIFIIILGSGFVISIAQMLLFILVYPFSKQWYRRINYYLCFSFYGEFVFMIQWWAGIEMEAYADQDDFDKYYGKEQGFCVENHSYDIDWAMGYMFCNEIHMLGNCKAYIKKALKHIPVIGWIWYFGDMVLLERSFEKDKITIRKQIADIATYPTPGWLLLYPEGTRFTEEKHLQSLIYSREKGLPEFKHHLSLRTKGFLTSLEPMRGKFNALYDLTLSFKKEGQFEPNVTSILLGKKMKAYLNTERIPFSEIPTDEKEAVKFLNDIFLKKDKMRDSFFRTGDFFAESGVKRPTKTFLIKGDIKILINALFWATTILSLISYYLISCFISKSYITLLFLLLTFCLLSISLKILVRYSKKSKGRKQK